MKSLIATWAILFALGVQGGTGSIAGTLRSADGTPQAGVRVAAMVVPGVPEAGASALVSITMTDDRGRYLLEAVPPGRYYIVSGNVATPTYYPGTFTPSSSSVVTVSAGSASIGYDFTTRPAAAPAAVPSNAFSTMRNFSGRIVTEDRSPLPNGTTMRVILTSPRGATSSSSLRPDLMQNAFRGFVFEDGEHRVSIAGFPAGYALKSISFGNVNLGLGPIKFDAASQGEIVLTLSVSPVAGFKVSGKLTNVPSEWTFPSRPIRLVSITTGGPTIETKVSPNDSFEFANVPAGMYQISFGELAFHSVVVPTINVAAANVTDVTVDFENNPFPEYPGVSFAPTFGSSQVLTLRGTVTQAVTAVRGRAPTKYFRMDVKDETTGTVTRWAILISSGMSAEDLTSAMKLTVGTSVTVSGIGARDGTRRLSLTGQPSGTINGQQVPQQ